MGNAGVHDAQRTEVLTPSIEVRNVSFRYAQGEAWVLRNVNVHIRAGESVAIAGPSGCGKTTLLKIMLGQLQPEEGEVLIGGIAPFVRTSPQSRRMREVTFTNTRLSNQVHWLTNGSQCRV